MLPSAVKLPVAMKELQDWRTGGGGASLIFFNSRRPPVLGEFDDAVVGDQLVA